jgi:prolyl 4-hydroxylase
MRLPTLSCRIASSFLLAAVAWHVLLVFFGRKKRCGERAVSLFPTDPSARNMACESDTVATLPGRPAARVACRFADPRVRLYHAALTHEECDCLLAASVSRLAPSTVVDPVTGEFVSDPGRKSRVAAFCLGETPLVTTIDELAASLAGLPPSHGEPLQVTHYGEGGEYRPHFDYFVPDDEGARVHLRGGNQLAGVEGTTLRGGQRVATVIFYLNDPREGGGTHFPSLGLTLVPKTGTALYFENSRGRDGTEVDPRTLHAGLPVIEGEKWIATKWFRHGPVS